MLLELNDERRFLSTDQVAKIIINKDPSYQLIDIRDVNSYQAYQLPGAVQLDLDAITSDSAIEELACAKYNHIFYGNGNLLADRAWYLHRLSGCQGGFVMKGGLNEWTKNILSPEVPPETADTEEMDLYAFRKAVSLFLTGNSSELETEPYIQAKPKKSITLKPKKIEKPKVIEEEMEEEEEEGC